MAFLENAPDSLARYGHDIHKQQVSGNATVHNGDINYVNATHEAVQNLLPRANGAQINSSLKEHEPSCLPGTRIEVLQYIKTWAEDGSDKRCVFWLSGMAGTGKSTIARTVARERLAQNQLGASFFFSKGGGDVGNARKFFTTIAFQLIQRSPALKAGILKIVKEKLDIGTLPLREQWELLILRPLALLRPELHQQPLLLVVDALDECEDEQHVQLILQLLASTNTHIRTVQLRVLVTSRPDTPIRLGFGEENPGIWHRDLVLNAVPRETVDHDITIYFSDQLKNIISSQDAHIIVRLVEKANGLFIWAATVCRYVKSGKRFANRRLSTILEKGMTALSPEKELDHIYSMILSDSISGDFEKDEKEILFSDFRNVVGAIVILFDPLSASALASLLRISEQDVKDVLDDLHSVLDVPASSVAPIRLLHPSFRDFLLSDKRCQETQLQVDEKHVHRTVVYHCLGVMSSSLRRDIGGLKRPGSLVSDFWRNRTNQCIRPELEYACLYWVQHLQKSDILLQDQVEVYQFLRLHLLHWLEALAWLGRTSEAILALITLEGQIQADKSPRLHEIVRDAKRFAVYNRRMIEEAPLQLYCSALIFAPEHSVIRRQFHQDMPDWIRTKPKVQQHWNAALHTLEGHGGDVTSVAFSPDNSWVASASEDGTVRLWDVATGAALQTLIGHSAYVTSVAISHDGSTLVSGSWDKTVRLWDAATGAPLQTLETCSHYVSSIAYSSDGKFVASRYRDRNVLIWDAVTGAVLQTLDGHNGYVTSVAFSPDGRSVLSGSDDRTVRLWTVATSAAMQQLKGYSGYVKSVVFSRDNKLVASWSCDNTVRLWEAATGVALQRFEGHSASVTSAAFSPDGRSVVSGSDDGIVQLWDVATGGTLQKLEGHSSGVTSVAISSDGRTVVSGSWDRTVQLWDAGTGAALQTLKGHSGVTSVAFSWDDKLVVSRSKNGGLGRWDVATGIELNHLDNSYHWASVAFSLNGEVIMTQSRDFNSRDSKLGNWDPEFGIDREEIEYVNSGYMGSVAISRDGRYVVCGLDDGTVRLWRVATSVALQTFVGHSGVVRSVAFSPDGSSVVSGSDDETVRLWDAATGAALQTLKGHSEVVTSVAFSPDGKSVVSGSDDGTVRLWNTASGAALKKLEGHSGRVRSVAFSTDGRSIVSGSANSSNLEDATVRLWDVAADATLQPLEGHSEEVRSVAFSPDGSSVVSGSDDGTVRLWDAATGAALQELEGHSGGVSSVAFSPDGRSIVSASSYDRTVRLWNAVTGALVWRQSPKLVLSAGFTPDGRLVGCGSYAKGMRLWDVATGTEIHFVEVQDDFSSIALSPDGRLIVTESCGMTERLWDTRRWPRSTDEERSIWFAVILSSVDKSVVHGQGDGTLWLRDATTGVVLRTLKGHSGKLSSVAFSLDGSWDVATGTALQTLEGHSGSVRSVVFSPDGKSVVSDSDDGTVRLWDTATGAALQKLKGYFGRVRSVAFSPDGRSIVSGSTVSLCWMADPTVWLWYVAAEARPQPLEDHCDKVILVVSSGWGKGTMRHFQAATGAAVQTRLCYSDSVALSSDSKLILSRANRGCGMSSKCKLWDAATGAALLIHYGDLGKLTSGTFSAAGEVVETFHLSGHWIKQDEENIIWLPPDHRGTLIGTHMGAIVLAQSSGRIIIMCFKSGPKAV